LTKVKRSNGREESRGKACRGGEEMGVIRAPRQQATADIAYNDTVLVSTGVTTG
jgi:hypothetical protein